MGNHLNIAAAADRARRASLLLEIARYSPSLPFPVGALTRDRMVRDAVQELTAAVEALRPELGEEKAESATLAALHERVERLEARTCR